MKVIHLIPHLKMGGAETLVKDYALNIDKDKFEIIVVTVSGKSNSFNEIKLRESNIRVIHLGDEILFDIKDCIITRTIKKIRRYKLFEKYVRREKPDIIHSHLDTNDFLFFLATKKLKIKLFHTLHSEVKVLFTNKTYKAATSYCVKKKNMVLIALHERMEREAIDLFHTDQCIIVNNGIDIQRFRNVEKDKSVIKEELSIEDTAFIMGHVGRFSTTKNHLFLIDIFVQLKKRCPESILVLIGTGELKEVIKAKVRDLKLENSVVFLGNRKDIPELMSIMDVFVFPSLYEGFGNVLVEAQAAGVKCIVSDKIPEEVFLTTHIKSLSLNESIEKWCDEILGKSSTENKYSDITKYDIKKVIKKLESIYMSSLE